MEQATEKQLSYIAGLIEKEKKGRLSMLFVGLGLGSEYKADEGPQKLLSMHGEALVNYAILMSIPTPQTKKEASEIINDLLLDQGQGGTFTYVGFHRDWAQPIIDNISATVSPASFAARKATLTREEALKVGISKPAWRRMVLEPVISAALGNGHSTSNPPAQEWALPKNRISFGHRQHWPSHGFRVNWSGY